MTGFRVFLEVYKQHPKSADSTVAPICIESLASLIVCIIKHCVGHLPDLIATLGTTACFIFFVVSDCLMGRNFRQIFAFAVLHSFAEGGTNTSEGSNLRHLT